MFLRSWVKGQNPARLYKIWFLHSPDVFLHLRQYGFCPDSWPRFRGRHCGTNALRWFCLRQKPKKPPLIPRRGARPKGPAGPFGNPGASRGSPETVCVSHKAKALCYNTVSFLPVRLIRAPVLKPRPRSRAGRSAANIRLACRPISNPSREARHHHFSFLFFNF